MAMEGLSGRQLKRRLLAVLSNEPLEKTLALVARFPARQVVNPLFSFLYSMDAVVKWRAVAAMGEAVAACARERMESARVIMRRLIWNLNDESGGIGWGSAEAMGEIMARSGRLAGEYAAILRSYIQPQGNYLEMEGLRRGALWGIGRVAHAHPGSMDAAAPSLIPLLSAPDPVDRGLAAWAAGAMPAFIPREPLAALIADANEIEIFIDGGLVTRRISGLAAEALGSPIRPGHPMGTT
jgi:hypothetical protein